jgi:RHH-type transcriptional regulator, rel operon repressor / antitoxin RelB
MGKRTITFRLDDEKKKALDAISESLDRDRSWVLGEAVDRYLEAHRRQMEHIREGVRQADARQFAKPSEVRKAFAKWRK